MMEVSKNFKDLRKLGLQNIVQYSAANVPFTVSFHRHLLYCHVYRSVWLTREAKPRFVKLTYIYVQYFFFCEESHKSHKSA